MDPTQQITNLYQQTLGRAPDEQGLQFWSGALNQGYTPEQIQAQLQASEEGQKYLTGIATPNNAGTVQTAAPPGDLTGATGTTTTTQAPTYAYQPVLSFADQANLNTGLTGYQDRIARDYLTYLGREASPEEIAYWENAHQQAVQSWKAQHPYATDWDAEFFAPREITNMIAQSPEAVQFGQQQLQALNPNIDVASMTQQQGLSYAPEGVNTNVAFRNPSEVDFANYEVQRLPFGTGYAGNLTSRTSLEGTLKDLYAYYFDRMPNAAELDWYSDINESQPWTVDSLVKFVTGSPEFQVRSQGGISAPTTKEWRPAASVETSQLRTLAGTGGKLPAPEQYNYGFDRDYAAALFDRRLSGFADLPEGNDAYKYIMSDLYGSLGEHNRPELTEVLGRGWSDIVSDINKLKWSPDEWGNVGIQERLANIAERDPERWALIQQYMNDAPSFYEAHGISAPGTFVVPEDVTVADQRTGITGQFKENADAAQAGGEQLLSEEEIQALVDSALAGQGGAGDFLSMPQDQAIAYLEGVWGTDPASWAGELVPVYESSTVDESGPRLLGYRSPAGGLAQGEGFGPDDYTVGNAPVRFDAYTASLGGPTYQGPSTITGNLTPTADYGGPEGSTYGRYEAKYSPTGEYLGVEFVPQERHGGWFNENLDWLGPLLVGGAAAWGGGLFGGAGAGSGTGGSTLAYGNTSLAAPGTNVTLGGSSTTLGGTSIGGGAAGSGVGSGLVSGAGSATTGGIGQLIQTGTSWINQNVFGWLPAPVQPIATNTLINTVLNGGDIKSALTSSLFTAGTNFLGKEIATALADVKGLEAIGGPNAVGRIAANAITTAVQGGDFSKIGINAISGIVGNTVAQQTGSKIAGQITAQLVNGMVQGADPMQMLTGIGASQLAQQLTGKVLPEGQARQLVTAYMTQVIKQAGQQALSGK